MKRTTLFLTALLAVVFILGLLRLNDLSLYTDSTRYLLWAQSLSEFSGWVDQTQPIPEAYVVNAPLYPLFIAPALWLPMSHMATAKVLTLLYGMMALGLLYVVTRVPFGDLPAMGVTLLLAIMPMTIVIFTEVLSEALFLLFVFAVLFILQDRERMVRNRKIAVIALLALIPLVREIGIALVAAVILVEFFYKDRRFALTVLVLTVSIFLLWSLRNLLFVGTPDVSQASNVQFVFQRSLSSPEESIAVEFWRRMVANLTSYRFELGGMILFPIPFSLVNHPSGAFLSAFGVLQAVKPYVAVVFVPSLLYGAWKEWMSGTNGKMRVLFVLLSFMIIMLYPVQDVRFLYPLLPFIILFCYRTLSDLKKLPRKGAIAATGVVALMLAIPNILTTREVIATNLRYRSWVADTTGHLRAPGAYYATPWEKVGTWLRENVPANAVIASSAKELAPFIGERKLLEINKAVPAPQFEDMLRDHDVTVLVSPVIQDGLYAYAFNLRESARLRPTLRTSIGSVVILGIPSLLRGNGKRGSGASIDSVLVSHHDLRSARESLLKSDYVVADSILISVLSRDPGNAEAAFQRVVARALSGDREGTQEAQQALFRTPRSTSYIPVARRLLQISEHLSNAQNLGDPSLQAGAYYLSARTAWDLGYTSAARAYLRKALGSQKDAFEPLIWSAFYALEDRDMKAATRYLGVLRETYQDDPIVDQLVRVDSLYHLLEREKDATDRSSLYMQVSSSFSRLELTSPAIDAAIAAVSSAPSAASYDSLRSVLLVAGKQYALERLKPGG